MKDEGENKKKGEDRKEETGVFFGGDRWAVWRRAYFGFKLEIEKKKKIHRDFPATITCFERFTIRRKPLSCKEGIESWLGMARITLWTLCASFARLGLLTSPEKS